MGESTKSKEKGIRRARNNEDAQGLAIVRRG